VTTQEFTYTAPEPFVIDFAPPLKDGAGTLDRLVLREPTSGEVWLAEQHLDKRDNTKSKRNYQRMLMSKVSGVPESALLAMQIGQFAKAARYLQDLVESNLDSMQTDDADPATMLSVTFSEPMTVSGVSYPGFTVSEPTQSQMEKAESALGNMSNQRMRLFQQTIVISASGLPAAVVSKLPISVLNVAATFIIGFLGEDRKTSG
jgi:hypothetical protein